jgi:nucleoid-associated protein EbfC
MLKGLGDIASLMKQAKEMQGRMSEIQDRLSLMRIRGSAGGGMVTIEVNGKLDVLGCAFDSTLYESGDREMLEELVVSAMNDAMNKSKQASAEAMQEVTGGLNIPGMEGMMSKLGLGLGGS